MAVIPRNQRDRERWGTPFFVAGEDGRTVFYPNLWGYGYWVDSDQRKQQLLALSQRANLIGFWAAFLLMIPLFALMRLVPVVLLCLAWLAAMVMLVAAWRWRVSPLLAGLVRTPTRSFRLARRSVAAAQSMGRLVFVLSACGIAALIGAWQFFAGPKPLEAATVALAFGFLAIWAAILAITKRRMTRSPRA